MNTRPSAVANPTAKLISMIKYGGGVECLSGRLALSTGTNRSGSKLLTRFQVVSAFQRRCCHIARSSDAFSRLP